VRDAGVRGRTKRRRRSSHATLAIAALLAGELAVNAGRRYGPSVAAE